MAAAENGNLTLINAGSFFKLPYISGVNANQLVYDDLTDELFVIDGNQITIYDYSTKAVKSYYNHSNTIKDLDIWYNK